MKNTIINNTYTIYPLYIYVIDYIDVFGFISWRFKWRELAQTLETRGNGK
jgi:hypothetical protein